MMAKDCQPFDFRKAGYVEEPLSRQIRLWSTRASKIFQERWRDLAPTTLEVSAMGPVTQSFATLTESFQPLTMGCPIQVQLPNMLTMLAVPKIDLLALIQEVLCEHPEEKPAPRNLTAVEMELSQLILDTFAGALSEAWPEKDPLTCQLGAIDLAPHRSRLFVGTEFMIVMNFSIKALAGNVIFQWALPRAVTAKALEPFIEKQVAQPTHNPRDSVQQIPIEVVFNLGKANLSMTDLTRLQVGDIIVLDQRVDEPVVGTMDDKPLYKGWPGRIGADQVFKISRIIT